MTNKEFYGRRDRLRAALTAAQLPPSAKLVGLTMLENVNREVFCASESGVMVCWPSVVRLMELTGLSERSVTRARAALIERRIVTRVAAGGRATAKYAFNTGWIDVGRQQAAAEETAAIVAAAETATATANHPPAWGANKGATDGARIDTAQGAKTPPLGAPTVAPKPLNKPEWAQARPRVYAGEPEARLRRALSPAEWLAWFSAAEVVVIDDTAVIEAPNRATASWIEDRLGDRVRAALGVDFIDVSVFSKQPSAALWPVMQAGAA